MGPIDKFSPIEDFYNKISSLQAKVITSQKQLLTGIAAQMAETVSQDGRLFIFGSGHSHMMAEEGFYRAGGLASVVPIFCSALMLHENPTISSRLERMAGLAEALLESYHAGVGDMIFIFSNSGVNQLPVEMALRSKARQLTVVAICSLNYARVAPLSPLGKRLDQVADLTIDNGGEPGDALAQIEGTPWRTGASSTILGALIWNCLLVECVQRMVASGKEPPLFASYNMPGAQEHNQAILEKWRGLNPHL